MIPVQIIEYLQEHQIPFVLHRHPRAVDGQRLAAALHMSGYKVAKSVIVRADGTKWIVVVPAASLVDHEKLAQELKVGRVELVSEDEFEGIFDGCELGAEPPFGNLYGMPVLVDESLTREKDVVFRAGSHTESLQVRYEDFARLERPTIAAVARPQIPADRWGEERPESHA